MMSTEELARWRELLIEQRTLWRLKGKLDEELEALNEKMRALVERPAESTRPIPGEK